uniref:hypothetical protein n=1 Tax=Vibrio campbellii TaxID=680 RepID=UPI000AAA8DE6
PNLPLALNSELTFANVYQGEELAELTISSPKRFIYFLKDTENYVNKRTIGVALAQILFFIAKLNHI